MKTMAPSPAASALECQQAYRHAIAGLTSQLLDIASVHSEDRETDLFTNGSLDDIRRYWKTLIDLEDDDSEADPIRLTLIECLISVKTLEQRLIAYMDKMKLAEDLKKISWDEPQHEIDEGQGWKPDDGEGCEDQFNFAEDEGGGQEAYGEGWATNDGFEEPEGEGLHNTENTDAFDATFDHSAVMDHIPENDDAFDAAFDYYTDRDYIPDHVLDAFLNEDFVNDFDATFNYHTDMDYVSDRALEAFLDEEFANDFDEFIDSFGEYYTSVSPF